MNRLGPRREPVILILGVLGALVQASTVYLTSGKIESAGAVAAVTGLIAYYLRKKVWAPDSVDNVVNDLLKDLFDEKEPGVN